MASARASPLPLPPSVSSSAPCSPSGAACLRFCLRRRDFEPWGGGVRGVSAVGAPTRPTATWLHADQRPKRGIMSVTSVNKGNRRGAVSVARGDGAAAALEFEKAVCGTRRESPGGAHARGGASEEGEETRPVLDWIFDVQCPRHGVPRSFIPRIHRPWMPHARCHHGVHLFQKIQKSFFLKSKVWMPDVQISWTQL
jgi:hypothetical protein